MRLLLDTNALIWALSEPEMLSSPTRKLTSDFANEVNVSIVSYWELAIKIAKGNLPQLHPSVTKLSLEASRQRIQTLAVDLRHLEKLLSLPPLHRDPFDRLIIAQALEDNLAVITADRIFADYGVALAG